MQPGTELNFITMTKPDEHRGTANRRLVRSLVLRNYHAKRRSRAIPPPKTSRAILEAIPKDQSLESVNESSTPLETYFSASLVDAFSVLPINLSRNDRYFLDQYVGFAAKLDALVDSPRLRKPLSNIYLPSAMKDQLMIECILLTGAQCDPRFRHHALFYKGRVLQSVNQSLDDRSRRTNDSTIAGLVKLETDAYLTGNRASYDLHASALYKIIGMRGGVQSLGMQGLLAQLVLRIDLAAASNFASTPYFEHNETLKHHVSIDSLNLGFLPPTILSNLSEELISVLNGLCSVRYVMRGSLSILVPKSLNTIVECEESLVTLVAQRKIVPPFLEIPDIHLCTCLAAEIYLVRVIRSHPINTHCSPSTSTDLLESLSRVLESGLHQQFLALLLWIAFMGSSSVDTPESVREWAMTISHIASSLGVRTWEEAKRHLRTFLWLEPRSEPIGQSLWSQVESLRAA